MLINAYYKYICIVTGEDYTSPIGFKNQRTVDPSKNACLKMFLWLN